MNSPFGVYIHVPFCASRCGYCDFNTYTPGELGSSASVDSYLNALDIELELAAESLGGALQPADTVFVGGGTPSMLGASGLAQVLGYVRKSFGIAPGAEVTTESNPESTSPEFFEGLLEAGYTRVSLGMQSASSRVLQVLERRHTPGRPVEAAKEARAAGFEHVNLDMIYGTPTETDADVQATVEQVITSGVDHVSAYSLIVEDGTRMARKVRRGELPAPDEDVYADRYTLIDAALVAAGYRWYEVSNWAQPGGECRHNLGYWRDEDWWGAGPGAHSHLGDLRFYNVKHPATYAQRLVSGVLPVAGVEKLTAAQRHEERVMLGLRLREGLPVTCFNDKELAKAREFPGLIDVSDQRVTVTEAGRLLADGMIADILVMGES